MARESGWAPLRHGTFRVLWTAQLASNVGGWMQTVGAQWLMLSLSGSATYLAFIQSAASLPVLLFAIPAGVAGDLVDRRRLLLLSESSMLVASLALGLLAARDLVTPWALLGLLFLVGSGQAWTSPTWQTLQPELVDPGERAQAIALGSVSVNLARAVGPALGGALVAATDPSVTFLVNAATFLVVILAVARWRAAPRPGGSALPREHAVSAMRVTGRYVANSPALRAVLLRAALFTSFASALWALLPSVAGTRLHLGSGGYGLLLGCVGAGAVAGATLLPRLRARRSPDQILAGASLAVALPAALLATVASVAVCAAGLVVAGVGWILALATLNATYQAMLPSWMKARGLAVYLVVFQGGTAIGSAVIGLLAARLGVAGVLIGAAALLALSPLATLRRPVPRIAPEELLPSPPEARPRTPGDAVPAGPVRVTVERWAAGDRQALVDAVLDLRRLRRRTGAAAWSAWSDAAEPDRIVEEFLVGSWDEHLRQHERETRRDHERVARATALTDPGRPAAVTHWVQVVHG